MAPILIDSLGQEIRSLIKTGNISDSLLLLSNAQISSLAGGYARKDSLLILTLKMYHDVDKQARDCIADKQTVTIKEIITDWKTILLMLAVFILGSSIN
jgi:hypothetical protein